MSIRTLPKPCKKCILRCIPISGYLNKETDVLPDCPRLRNIQPERRKDKRDSYDTQEDESLYR